MHSLIRLEQTTKILRSDLAGKYLYTLGPLDLEVVGGEIFGYLGPNGAGKTTTIKLIMGLLRPSSGRILCFGEPARCAASRSRIGFLPEQPYFYQHLTARELLHFYGKLFGLSGSGLKDRVNGLLRMVGLQANADTKLTKFSKGMLQRIGLAQALINNPDLVILDEPLAGLDPVGRRELRDLIIRLKGEGRTVFFSSHILQDVEMICDRVAILAAGKILRTAKVEEVLYGSVTSYEILVTKGPVDLVRKLGLGKVSTRGDKTLILMSPETDLNSSINRLMSLGMGIEAVTPVHPTLEDYFMRELKHNGLQPETRQGTGQRLLAASSKESRL
jgi:ABC-2 type transport system ATP-binding protein